MSEIKTLHEPFMRWLKDMRLPYTRSRSDMATTGQCGDADFMVHHQGRCLMIEFKTKEGKLSAGQVKRHAQLKEAGCPVYVVRDLEPAMLLTREWMNTLPVPAAAQSTGRIITKMWGGRLCSFREEANGR